MKKESDLGQYIHIIYDNNPYENNGSGYWTVVWDGNPGGSWNSNIRSLDPGNWCSGNNYHSNSQYRSWGSQRGETYNSYIIHGTTDAYNEYRIMMEKLQNYYDTMLNKGVAPEMARMVLPQSMMTEWYWSGTLYAFARVCQLRCAKDTQAETRMVADQIDKICAEQFPKSWKYLK